MRGWLKGRATALWGRTPRSPVEVGSIWVLGLPLGVLAFVATLSLPLPLALAGWAVAAGLGLLLAWRAEPILWETPLAAGEDAEPVPPAVEPLPPQVPPLLDLVEIPGGTFLMGSPPAGEGQIADFARRWDESFGGKPAEQVERIRNWLAQEQPAHRVRVSPFLLGRVPVTRGQWRALMTEAPEAWSRLADDDELPATDVDWPQSLTFCNALSAREGLTPCYRRDEKGEWHWDSGADGYRLPTEAEWEYGCRAGGQSQWFWGDDPEGADAHAWHAGNAKGQVQAVGGKAANAWGLRDMAGLVLEWCWDRYGPYPQETRPPVQDPTGPLDGSSRVVRGGSFDVPPFFLRSAVRFADWPGFLPVLLGLRCVRSRARQH